MTAAATGDIFRTFIHWRLHSQECFNVLHFKADGTPDIETGLNTAIQTAFTSGSANAHFSTDVLLVDINSIRVYPTLSPSFLKVCGNAGTAGGDSMVSTSAILAQIRTAAGGRRARGRFYVPGVASSFIADSRFTAGAFTFLGNLTASFITPATAPRWQLGMFSRKDGGIVIPVNPAGFKAATSLTFDSVVATMRSRRIGRGH